MKFSQCNAADSKLVRERLEGFVPRQVFDAHAHLFDRRHFVADNLYPMLKPVTALPIDDFHRFMSALMPGSAIEGLFFGFPNRGNDRVAVNRWMAEEIRRGGGTNSRVLALTSPEDKPESVMQQIRELGLVGVKPYHVYAARPDTGNARIEEFVPEWMWEICHGIDGVLMLHIVKPRALADPENQADIRRLCRKYPKCRLVLAHVSRSFNYRHGREGLGSLVDLDNVWVDMSAVTETESMRRAIEALGPKRFLFGTDYPISQLRGRCVALADSFFWIYPETAKLEGSIPPNGESLIGVESLLCLREACEDAGLNDGDVQDIFRNNALRLLEPHLEKTAVPKTPTGPELWSEAWKRVSGGTGLLSKRAELYDPKSWPAYFSKCLGADVWDLTGRHFIDFTGGVGAVLLGYADPDVTRAVKRRLNLGTHGTLCTPDEVELADILLELHPWAQRIRYARGGGEALGVAVRIARAATGKSGIAFCGYHGWQDWYLAANLADDKSLDGHLLPGLQPLGVPRELMGTSVPFLYNDLASFEKALAKLAGKLAGVMMEPFRSQQPKDAFVEKVAKRCREAGGVFMIDEVTSGWRFGFPGGHNAIGIQPDIAVYAKAISNGFPCAAIIGRESVMDAANPSFISSTYWTDGVGPAAAIACLRKMKRIKSQEYVTKLGGQLQSALQTLAGKYPELKLTIGGQPSAPSIGFNLGADTQAAKQLLVRKMVERGFLLSGQCYIMAAHTESHVSALLDAIAPALKEIAQLQSASKLQSEAGPRGGVRDAMGTGFARLA